ncbi:MAG: threonylcarbamoyl-AMP synthase [Bacteroidales bacterium]|nr:MAG: threonylcarbamoyl-AMP synthase [Bacteroidales bacterium]
MKDALNSAVNILRSGGIILYPTDTIWGIGCDATNPEAVDRIYKIKQREDSKSMLVLIDKVGRIPSYVSEMPDLAWDLVELADKPLTIIYPNAKGLAKNLIAPDGSVGIRVANHDFCSKLIGRFGKPIVSTSANISGKPYPKSFCDIEEEIKDKVDFIVPEEFDHPISDKPSGIIMLGVNGEIKVIRE